MSRTRWALLGVASVIAVIGFLLFRPDTLITEVRAEESLEDAFDSVTSTEPGSGSGTTSTTASTPTSTSETDATTAAAASEPVALLTGQFEGIDHEARGTATIYEQNGRFALRFEDDTDIQNGPDLYVWLIPTEAYEGGTPQEFIDLGTLKGTVGGQNYELAADFDAGGPWTVLVWCLRFDVPFAAAPLG